MLKDWLIRRKILQLLITLQDEGYVKSFFSNLLWLVYRDKPLTIFVDSGGRVTTVPDVPHAVVYTEEL